MKEKRILKHILWSGGRTIASKLVEAEIYYIEERKIQATVPKEKTRYSFMKRDILS